MHAHELEAAGKARWTARIKDGLVLVKDEASDEEIQATAYTHDGNTVSFALPGDNGLRSVEQGKPGYDALLKVFKKAMGDVAETTERSVPANEKPVPGAKSA